MMLHESDSVSQRACAVDGPTPQKGFWVSRPRQMHVKQYFSTGVLGGVANRGGISEPEQLGIPLDLSKTNTGCHAVDDPYAYHSPRKSKAAGLHS